uniref:Methionyl/Valyl/Leucyl/Isoleucyl-tRNA synthetase anticodon-binding domain-containing protein n=1 Tax=Strombidium rassoulzadegani TaxID=1082188 RepID=A0A7S3CPZ5_9SPIT|mmetsp:Transcript_3334/g.5537  ORF Transcript_3334/g.5537 Transcript_3334/m.5537 type:complete len:292 (+) Transcript_3334:2773-3648(+)
MEPAELLMNQSADFGLLSSVDKMVQMQTMQFMLDQQHLLDVSLDIRAYSGKLEEFAESTALNFYLEFAQNRLKRLAEEKEGQEEGKYGLYRDPRLLKRSTLQTLNLVLQALLVSASPILVYTCQELFDALDSRLLYLPESAPEKPKTVFQMVWPLDLIKKSQLLDKYGYVQQRFEHKDALQKILEVREKVGAINTQFMEKQAQRLKKLNEIELESGRGPKYGPKRLKVVFVEGVARNEKEEFEVADAIESVLENDLEDFFFGCRVQVVSKESKAHEGKRRVKVKDNIFCLL